MKSSLKSLSITACAAFILLCSSPIATFAHPTPEATKTVYEYKQFSTIESVIPGGAGRSRILTTDDEGQLIEKDLKNFYSLFGINFGNIANNDRAIVDRLNQYSNEGWELMQVTTGSHAQASEGSTGGGLFITRYLFRRSK